MLPGEQAAKNTVLIVDDDPSLVKATSRLLHSMGFKALSAAGGREAIEICRSATNEISVVLLDLVLSGESSLELLRQLRSLRPEMKVILTSGYGKQESIAQFEGFPLDGFLLKPYGYIELENTIKSVLARASRTSNK